MFVFGRFFVITVSKHGLHFNVAENLSNYLVYLQIITQYRVRFVPIVTDSPASRLGIVLTPVGFAYSGIKDY